MTDKITKSESKAVISLSTGVFLVFLFLKLAEMGKVADWSWWWVTSPLWIPLAIIMIILILVVIAAIILGAISTFTDLNFKKKWEDKKSYFEINCKTVYPEESKQENDSKEVK